MNRFNRLILRFIVITMVLGVFTELTLRFAVGLGDPPLLMADPEIEYLYKPSREYSRFHNRIAYNAYSMRCDDFPVHKSSPDELRVMVLGDSVINGGNLTDQEELATEIIKKRLSEETGRQVVVGNISAGSWGPGNLMAYVNRFGLFDADVVAIVLSSHDYADVPDFQPRVGIVPGMPDHTPLSAIQEVFGRYLPHYLYGPGKNSHLDYEPSDELINQSLASLRDLIQASQDTGAEVLIFQHLERSEVLSGKPMPGHDLIKKTAESMNVTVIQLGPVFEAVIQSQKPPYRDAIHPNALGQRILAQAIVSTLGDKL